MDAFEQVRGSAERLHDELVAQGSDPLNTIALVDAAVRKLNLELAWLAAGDPALKGARAIFDEQTGTVCCETVGEPGERAVLVAHEIGHAYIHRSSSFCNADDIDPSRSTESAPVGLQRVEDYGVRERRELQANVFAREFVLPRPLARRLFIEDGLGASAITERTGLPKSVVRQQILDAILIPRDTGETRTEEDAGRPQRPDVSQDRTAAHRGSPFQLQAGPGTGKTRTLVKRALSLLAEGIDPAAILILTYSNRAAGELVERIAAAAPDAAARIWVGTFHAFGLELVRRYHDRLGLPSNPALFDRSDAIEVLQDVLPTLPLTHYRNLWDPAMELREVVQAISRAKDEMTDPKRFRALAQAMLDEAADDDARVAAEKCLEVAHIYDLYERAVHERGAVDFGDLIMRPAMLLEADLALRTAVQLRHRHVLVDEYQDVNRASARLLKAVAGDGKRLWTVGELAAIYLSFSRSFVSQYGGVSPRVRWCGRRSAGNQLSLDGANCLGIRWRGAAYGCVRRNATPRTQRRTRPWAGSARRFDATTASTTRSRGWRRVFANWRPPASNSAIRPCSAARTSD